MPAPASALSWPLRAFTSWHFSIYCPPCRFLARLDMDRLRGQRGDWFLVGDVAGRLRCGQCGRVPGSVDLADGAEGAGRAATRLKLVVAR